MDPGTYDGELGMYRQPGGLIVKRLAFERWLAFRGLSEHVVAGPPCGEYASESVLEVYAAGRRNIQEAVCSRP